MVRPVEIEGAAHLVMTDAVVPLHPEDAVFDAMLLGWRRRSRTAHGSSPADNPADPCTRTASPAASEHSASIPAPTATPRSSNSVASSRPPSSADSSDSTPAPPQEWAETAGSD